LRTCWSTRLMGYDYLSQLLASCLLLLDQVSGRARDQDHGRCCVGV
jgi:hypothetical protein